MTILINQKYAHIIVDIPASELNMRSFSYLIPEELRDKIKIGSPVVVPFGKQDNVFGYVVGFGDYLAEGIRAREILDLLDDEALFDLKYLEFIEWVSNYYMCNLVDTLGAAIPSGLWSSTKRIVSLTESFEEKILDKLDKNEKLICQILLKSKKNQLTPLNITYQSKLPRKTLYNILRNLKSKGVVKVQQVMDANKAKSKLIECVELISSETTNKRYKAILDILETQPDKRCETKSIVELAKTTRPTIKKLAEQGLIKIYQKEDYRNPLERFANVSSDEKFKLTSYQQEALEGILKSLEDEKNPGPLLLHGVTASGKTEVYFQVIEHLLKEDKSSIFLVPEITLTSQIASRMIARFGNEKVGIWHSSLSSGERLDIWRKIHSGEIKIVLGARSAVFTPVKNLGLIIIDEEQESAYKQDTPNPRYHAREVALERARRFNGKVLLGSATPDITTYYKAKNQNSVYILPYRIEKRPMADIKLIDMKEEILNGNKTIFSRSLSYEIQENLAKKEQTILLINRRGYTTYVFCRICGYVAQCKNCSIPLIFHATSEKLRCHYCNYQIDTYKVCPECNSGYIKHYGLGTQRVEDEIKRKFPDATVLRLDSDVTTRKNAHHEIIETFSEHKADILIGTQMVAKGLDMPGVTLVGVLSADSSFVFPDYRSMERGFQLLTQVAGRAGRGKRPGKVLFQCYSPNIYPILCAQKQDYHSFYAMEIIERERYGYPPYSQLIRIVISSEDHDQAFAETIILFNHLVEKFKDLSEKIQILGPGDCIIPKIQKNYRLQILIKNLLSTHGHTLISAALKEFNAGQSRVIIDVDPLNML